MHGSLKISSLYLRCLVSSSNLSHSSLISLSFSSLSRRSFSSFSSSSALGFSSFASFLASFAGGLPPAFPPAFVASISYFYSSVNSFGTSLPSCTRRPAQWISYVYDYSVGSSLKKICSKQNYNLQFLISIILELNKHHTLQSIIELSLKVFSFFKVLQEYLLIFQ